MMPPFAFLSSQKLTRSSNCCMAEQFGVRKTSVMKFMLQKSMNSVVMCVPTPSQTRTPRRSARRPPCAANIGSTDSRRNAIASSVSTEPFSLWPPVVGKRWPFTKATGPAAKMLCLGGILHASTNLHGMGSPLAFEPPTKEAEYEEPFLPATSPSSLAQHLTMRSVRALRRPPSPCVASSRRDSSNEIARHISVSIQKAIGSRGWPDSSRSDSMYVGLRLAMPSQIKASTWHM